MQNRIITIVPCQPAEIELEERRLLLTAEEIESRGYLGRIPLYYLNNKEKYSIFCCLLRMKKIFSDREFVLKAKHDLQRVLDDPETTQPIVLCVEKSLVEILIEEFNSPFTGPAIEYFLPDFKEYAEVRTSLRKVIISKQRGKPATALSVKIGKKEVISVN